MKISLIICVYNRLELLHKCLLSICGQIRMPDEIVLTDDGSDEDIEGFFHDHAHLFPIPFRLVRQEHKGFRLARLRNNGVYASTGDLLMFIDQDIVISPAYIRKYEQSIRPGRFFVSYPVRLDRAQSQHLDEATIAAGNFTEFMTPRQMRKPVRQFYKDRTNLVLHQLGLAPYGAKLRGGVCGILREDFYRVNGYDEHFVGWGNEDDDMGRRLLASGKVGLNVTRREYCLHLYHEPHHQNGARVNQDYADNARKRIDGAHFRCVEGIEKEREDIRVINVPEQVK